MKTISVIEEPVQLSQYGWKFHEKCRCAGKLKYSYRHPRMTELELDWWPRLKAFKVTYLGVTTKVPASSLPKLERTLKNLRDEYGIKS